MLHHSLFSLIQCSHLLQGLHTHQGTKILHSSSKINSSILLAISNNPLPNLLNPLHNPRHILKWNSSSNNNNIHNNLNLLSLNLHNLLPLLSHNKGLPHSVSHLQDSQICSSKGTQDNITLRTLAIMRPPCHHIC